MNRKQAEALRVGATIKALREAYGWRSTKFAIAIGMTHGHLSNIEAGRKAATPEKLRAIADVLGVPLAALTTEYAIEDVA